MLLGQLMRRLHVLGLHWLPKVCVSVHHSAATQPVRDTGVLRGVQLLVGLHVYWLCDMMSAKNFGTGTICWGRNFSHVLCQRKKSITKLHRGYKEASGSPQCLSLTANCGKGAVASKKRGLIFCHVPYHGFLPLRPYPSYYGSKLAVKKCWQLGVLLLQGCSVSQCKQSVYVTFTIRAAVRHKSYTFSLTAARGDPTRLCRGDFLEGMLRYLLLCLPENIQAKYKVSRQLGQNLVLLHNKAN